MFFRFRGISKSIGIISHDQNRESKACALAAIVAYTHAVTPVEKRQSNKKQRADTANANALCCVVKNAASIIVHPCGGMCNDLIAPLKPARACQLLLGKS